jgi:ATP-dependent RNA helicase DOB1
LGKVSDDKNPMTAECVLIVDVLLHVDKARDGNDIPKPCPDGEVSVDLIRYYSNGDFVRISQQGDVEVVPVVHNLIHKISSVRVYYPKDLRSVDHRKSVLKTINEVKKRFPEGPPLLNPIKDMKITEPTFESCVKKIEELEQR